MAKAASSVATSAPVIKRRRVGLDVASRRRLARQRRHLRLRKKLSGTPQRPRLVVNRSSRHIAVQLVEDLAGHTLAAAASFEPEVLVSVGGEGLVGDALGRLPARLGKR